MRQETKLNYLIIYSVILTVVLLTSIYKNNYDNSHFNILEIKDTNNISRVILSAEVPDPKLDGKIFKREIDPSGIVFYDNKGNETGGIGINNINEQELNVFAFDYDQSEAIFLFKIEKEKQEEFHSGLVIKDKPIYTNDPKTIISKERVVLENKNGIPSLKFNDRNGKTRILMQIDSNNIPKIQILDSLGNILKELS